MSKKVSIITICYNSAATIRDTIKSVIAQDYPNIEYILVDGKSTDETMSIISEFEQDIAKIVSEPDKGIYDAMNKGVALATGDVIGILNSDDFYSNSSVISRVVDQFNASPGAEALYADLIYVDQADTNKVVRYWKSGNYEKGLFLKGWMPPHPTLFVSSDVYERFGAYNIKLKSAADYEFMLRVIHKEQITLIYLPLVITKMRVGGQSNVSFANRVKANKEDRMAWELNGLKPKWNTMLRKPIGKIRQYFNSPPK